MALGTNYKRNSDKDSQAIERRIRMANDFAKVLWEKSAYTREDALEKSCLAVMGRKVSDNVDHLFAEFKLEWGKP